MFAHCLTSFGIYRCSGFVSRFTFVNIYTSISDKSSLVLIDSDHDFIIIFLLFATVLLPGIHKIIELISEDNIFRLTQAETTLQCSFLFSAIFSNSFAQKLFQNLH